MHSRPMTRYMNPTRDPMTMSFQVNKTNYTINAKGEITDVRSPKYETFTIPPGETVEIPSEYDRGMHQISGNVILGGLAPMAINLDAPAKVHPSLVPVYEEQPIALTSAELIERLRAPTAAPSSDPDAARVAKARMKVPAK